MDEGGHHLSRNVDDIVCDQIADAEVLGMQRDTSLAR